MSLHAQLSPDAEARFEIQRRNSTLCSLVIALLSVFLLGLVLALILIRPLLQESPTVVAYSGPTGEDKTLRTRKVSSAVQRRPSAPSSSMAKVIAANTTSPTAVPVPDMDVPDPAADFGSGYDFGDGWGGDGDGIGGGFGNIPATMRKRCSPEDRLQRLQENGGTEQCEEAVLRGLRWLKATQAQDGSWGQGNKAAMTGLALLAYLGHCETPLSEEFGDSVLRGMVFLTDLGMRNNGRLSTNTRDRHWPYEHAIATYALAEGATFATQLGISVPDLEPVVQQAGQYIINNQHKSGGWDYAYSESSDRGGDLSITAWHIQALKACHHTGIDFRNMRRCVTEAMEFVNDRADRSGGFGYTGKGPAGDTGGYHTLTGAGVLSLQLWDKGSHSNARAGAKYIEKRSRFDYNTGFCDLYGHYYESQAMMNRGGEQWKSYNAMFRDQVLNNQNPDGSWKNPGGGQKPRAVGANFIGGSPESTHYRTCLCILMLEVYYRFLPGTGAGVRR